MEAGPDRDSPAVVFDLERRQNNINGNSPSNTLNWDDLDPSEPLWVDLHWLRRPRNPWINLALIDFFFFSPKKNKSLILRVKAMNVLYGVGDNWFNSLRIRQEIQFYEPEISTQKNDLELHRPLQLARCLHCSHKVASCRDLTWVNKTLTVSSAAKQPNQANKWNHSIGRLLQQHGPKIRTFGRQDSYLVLIAFCRVWPDRWEGTCGPHLHYMSMCYIGQQH